MANFNSFLANSHGCMQEYFETSSCYFKVLACTKAMNALTLGLRNMHFAYFSLHMYTSWLATSAKPFNAFKTAFDKRYSGAFN